MYTKSTDRIEADKVNVPMKLWNMPHKYGAIRLMKKVSFTAKAEVLASAFVLAVTLAAMMFTMSGCAAESTGAASDDETAGSMKSTEEASDNETAGMKSTEEASDDETAGSMKSTEEASDNETAGSMKSTEEASDNETAGSRKLTETASDNETAGSRKLTEAASDDETAGSMKSTEEASDNETAGSMKSTEEASDNETAGSRKLTETASDDETADSSTRTHTEREIKKVSIENLSGKYANSGLLSTEIEHKSFVSRMFLTLGTNIGILSDSYTLPEDNNKTDIIPEVSDYEQSGESSEYVSSNIP